MKLSLGVFSLNVLLVVGFASNSVAAPMVVSQQTFPDLTTFNCVALFEGEAVAVEQGRISCARNGADVACVVGENPTNGARAAARLAAGARLASRDSRNTNGALVIKGDRGVIAGTTKGAGKAQQAALIGRAYNKSDGVVIPAVETAAGVFAKATLVVPVNLGAHQYDMQDANFIIGRDADGDTSFYGIVTPENDVVVQYIQTGRQGGLRCSNIPSEILGRYLVAPGIAFVN
jgi:hypothetical protein